MKPAEEFIKEHIPDCHEWADWGMEATVKAMQAYAREAIAEHLERAADSAKLKHLPGQYGAFVNVDRDSIRNIEIILK